MDRGLGRVLTPKREFWEEISRFMVGWYFPWVVGRDNDTTRFLEDSTTFTEQLRSSRGSLMITCSFIFLMTGAKFTW